MKVYVCFTDYGWPEGCSEPKAVFETKAEAEDWVRLDDNYRVFSEMTVGEINE